MIQILNNEYEYLLFSPSIFFLFKTVPGTVKENGVVYKTTKGAPHVLLKLCDNAEISHQVEHEVHQLGLRGVRSLAVAKTDSYGTWHMLGLLTFLDPPRPDTKQTIEEAVEYGVKVKMITGDHYLIAKETARVLEMGDYVVSAAGLPLLDAETKEKPKNLSRDYGDLCLAADGFSQVFPEHKYLIVECLRELGYKVGMTGDGVNDAPALKRADVGVAVAGATDAARAAADIILTEEGLGTIIHGIKIARCIFNRIFNFIVYRISATLQLLVFFFIAVFAFPPSEYAPKNWQTVPGFDEDAWPGFFHMPVLLLMLITLLNDGTLIAIGYDNVDSPQEPCVWNIPLIFALGSLLAAVACASSILLLHLLLDSWSPGGFFQKSGMGGISYGQVTMSIYLKVSISDFLTLFSARTGGEPFWSTYPAPILLGAGCIALSASTAIACAWPASKPDGIYSLGLGLRDPKLLALWIWLYCIVWWFIQDFCKVVFIKLSKQFNFLNINDTGKLVLPESTLRYIDANKENDMEAAGAKQH